MAALLGEPTHYIIKIGADYHKKCIKILEDFSRMAARSIPFHGPRGWSQFFIIAQTSTRVKFCLVGGLRPPAQNHRPGKFSHCFQYIHIVGYGSRQTTGTLEYLVFIRLEDSDFNMRRYRSTYPLSGLIKLSPKPAVLIV